MERAAMMLAYRKKGLRDNAKISKENVLPNMAAHRG
jgi:hypothetical protein